MAPAFSDTACIAWLEEASAEALDALAYGVIVMTSDGVVVGYNRAEADLSGLAPARVIGRHFFTAVAPCTNNYIVAQRFELEPELDVTVDYVFTLRMAPKPVRLRLLKRLGAPRMYLLVERRQPHVD